MGYAALSARASPSHWGGANTSETPIIQQNRRRLRPFSGAVRAAIAAAPTFRRLFVGFSLVRGSLAPEHGLRCAVGAGVTRSLCRCRCCRPQPCGGGVFATPPRPRVCCVGMPRTSLCVWLVLAVESRVEMNAKGRALDTPTKTSERLREVRVMVIGKGRFLVRSPPPPPPPQGGGTWLWDRNRRNHEARDHRSIGL